MKEKQQKPQHLEMKFDAIVANPPFSTQWSANPMFMSDDRFSSYGKLAPSSKADLAFVQHMVYHLSEEGTMAVVLPHGVLKSAYHYKYNPTNTPINVILDDSSLVTLQPTAKIYYSVRQFHKREIFLEGDAFFNVTKNKEAPFYVYAGSLVTKVLGTSFNITTPR